MLVFSALCLIDNYQFPTVCKSLHSPNSLFYIMALVWLLCFLCLYWFGINQSVKQSEMEMIMKHLQPRKVKGKYSKLQLTVTNKLAKIIVL